MPIGTDDGQYHDDQMSYLLSQARGAKEQAISIRPVQDESTTPPTMPSQAPTEPAGALKPSGGTNIPGNQYETSLTPQEETKFQDWKQQNAPNDSGFDYDLRGAFKAGVQPDVATGHWPDTFKKPNHLTFSDQSQYAKDRPDLAGTWQGDTYYPAPYGLNPPESTPSFRPRTSEMLKGFYETAKKALDLPNTPTWALDQTTGEIHTSPQAIEKAADLAGLMTFGPAPVASKMAEGTLGSFAGVRSKGWERSKLGEAQVLEANAASQDEIWNKTGFFRGADNRWRYEISDKDMKLNEDVFHKNVTLHPTDPTKDITTYSPTTKTETPKLDTIEDLVSFMLKSKEKPVTLEQAIDHPALFKAYPELKSIKVRELPPDEVKSGVGGMMWHRELFLAPDLTKEKARSIIMHEIQHEIQNIEGFARGGNTDIFKYPLHDVAESHYNRIRDDELAKLLKRGYTGEHILDLITQVDTHLRTGEPLSEFFTNPESAGHEVGKKIFNLTKAEYLLQQDLLRRHALYSRIKGEVESRNVEARLDFEDVTRKLFPPSITEDIPRFMQHEPEGTEASRAQSVTTFRRGANENIKDLNNPNLSKVEQLAIKLAETENGKGSWDRIGGGGQEHYLRDAQRAIKEPGASVSEGMVQRTKEIDRVNEEIYRIMKRFPYSELDRARLKKLQQERLDIWK